MMLCQILPFTNNNMTCIQVSQPDRWHLSLTIDNIIIANSLNIEAKADKSMMTFAIIKTDKLNIKTASLYFHEI